MKTDKEGRIFARVSPKKITLKETYYYKATAGMTSALDFDKAEGEIALEFVYDGKYNGLFSHRARQDLKVQDPENKSAEAHVGRLAIVKAGQTSLKSLQLDGRTIPITVDVSELQKKLESSQKVTTKFNYCPDQPKTAPVRLGEAGFIDQDPPQANLRADLFRDFMPHPSFTLQLMATLPDNLGKATDLIPTQLQDSLDLKKLTDTEFLAADATPEEIYQVLSILTKTNRGGYVLVGVAPDGNIDGLSESEVENLPKRVAQAILLAPQAPLPVPKPNTKTIKVKNEEKEVGLIVVPSGLANRPDRPKNEARFIQKDHTINRSLLENLTRRGQNEEIAFVSESSSVEELAQKLVALANTRGGYILFDVEEMPNDQPNLIRGMKDEKTEALVDKIHLAFDTIKPSLRPYCRQNNVPLERDEDEQKMVVLILSVSNNLTDVYSTGGEVWRRVKKENKELESTEIFELLTERYTATIEKPFAARSSLQVRYGSTTWPYVSVPVDGLTNTPDKYDPVRGALEWHKIEFQNVKQPALYSTRLNWIIENPEDLVRVNGTQILHVPDVKGYFEISLGSTLLSDLEIAYYNALGESLSTSTTKEENNKKNKKENRGNKDEEEDKKEEEEKEEKERQTISYQTIIKLEVDLRVNELFRKRRLIPYRHLEFDGIRPEWDRCHDVRETLSDLGFRIVENGVNEYVPSTDMPSTLIIKATKRSHTGEISLFVRFLNDCYRVLREIKYGDRKDKMTVTSGRMALDIYGWVEGEESQELVEILNTFQKELKERFKYIKVS